MQEIPLAEYNDYVREDSVNCIKKESLLFRLTPSDEKQGFFFTHLLRYIAVNADFIVKLLLALLQWLLHPTFHSLS